MTIRERLARGGMSGNMVEKVARNAEKIANGPKPLGKEDDSWKDCCLMKDTSEWDRIDRKGKWGEVRCIVYDSPRYKENYDRIDWSK